MGKLELGQQPDRVAVPDADGGRGPFADAVDREDRGAVERAREDRKSTRLNSSHT